MNLDKCTECKDGFLLYDPLRKGMECTACGHFVDLNVKKTPEQERLETLKELNFLREYNDFKLLR